MSSRPEPGATLDRIERALKDAVRDADTRRFNDAMNELDTFLCIAEEARRQGFPRNVAALEAYDLFEWGTEAHENWGKST
jgi:hypothetical protein